jgi:hypothetical protein
MGSGKRRMLRKMGYRDIDLRVLRKTIAKVTDPFFTKDVSEHPDMLRAHPEIAQHSHYHSFVGRCISRHLPEVRRVGHARHRRGAKWTTRVRRQRSPS